MTIYIRTEDLSKWVALENKSEFIHNALNRDIPKRVKHLDRQLAKAEALVVDNLEDGQVKPIEPPKLMNRFPGDEAAVVTLEDIKRSVGVCEHGAGKGLCKIKGCKNYQFK